MAEKELRFLIPAAVFGILGVLFVITGVLAPAPTTQFQYQPPTLSWFVFANPQSIGILGTGPQAQQLQIAIGFIFLVVAYLFYRRA